MQDCYIGWDVGGWNCERNGKSRDAIVILNEALEIVGTPWRGNLRETINASKSSNDWKIALFDLCNAELPDPACITLAIDTPLGFSGEFTNLITRFQFSEPIETASTNPYLFRQTERYRLLAWCIMPNHVHVLIMPLVELGKIVQSWKSYTGRWALGHNAELGLGVPGKSFWMREYWDRFIRDERHYAAVVEYVHNNPVKAGLCATPEEWRWSSATKPGRAENPGSAVPLFGSVNGDRAEMDHAELGLGAPGEGTHGRCAQ